MTSCSKIFRLGQVSIAAFVKARINLDISSSPGIGKVVNLNWQQKQWRVIADTGDQLR